MKYLRDLILTETVSYTNGNLVVEPISVPLDNDEAFVVVRSSCNLAEGSSFPSMQSGRNSFRIALVGVQQTTPSKMESLRHIIGFPIKFGYSYTLLDDIPFPLYHDNDRYSKEPYRTLYVAREHSFGNSAFSFELIVDLKIYLLSQQELIKVLSL